LLKLDFADIGQFIDQPVKTYSSGMYVRLAFAVQACIDPEILIVDEALAVGDIGFQYKCFKRMEMLKQRNNHHYGHSFHRQHIRICRSLPCNE
jgi:lipopolysaccharide transport system ATP-binding protein